MLTGSRTKVYNMSSADYFLNFVSQMLLLFNCANRVCFYCASVEWVYCFASSADGEKKTSRKTSVLPIAPTLPLGRFKESGQRAVVDNYIARIERDQPPFGNYSRICAVMAGQVIRFSGSVLPAAIRSRSRFSRETHMECTGSFYNG